MTEREFREKLFAPATREVLTSTTASSGRMSRGYTLSEEEGEHFWLFGALATIKISADDTAGQYCLIDLEMPTGVGTPLHIHRDEDEWFYVREGAFAVYIGDAQLTLTAGEFAFGPKGVPHTFMAGPDGGKMLVGCGAKFEGLLREIGEPSPQRVLPPPPEGPPDMDLLLPIADRWAYDILGPPGPPPGR
jgi:mannose-6-phosphate isomerase-like protein (cupin superfamily)